MLPQRCSVLRVPKDYRIAIVAGSRAFQDLGASLFHVVVGADAYRRDALLWTDDMLERGQEFTRQIAVGNQYDTNHVVRSAPAPPAPPAASASRWERVTERPAPRNQSASSSATATER